MKGEASRVCRQGKRQTREAFSDWRVEWIAAVVERLPGGMDGKTLQG